MLAEFGRRSRAARLGDPGPVNLVALDHGISLGWTDSQDSPADIAAECYRWGVRGVVCHAGIIGQIRQYHNIPVFLQMHGSTPTDSDKAQLLTAKAAARADCIGVAVEYQVRSRSEALGVTARAIEKAQGIGLLVLVMANYPGDEYELAAKAVVAATQLGADYIKLAVPMTAPTEKEANKLRKIIADGPPVLLAGGRAEESLSRRLGIAVDLGMSGTCIGRHYFDASMRRSTLQAVQESFPPQ